MANISKLKSGFYTLVVLSLLSFFICISIGNAWFLLYIFLPYVAFHIVLSFIISSVHNRVDKQTQYRASVANSGAWTRRNYLGCIGLSSIIHTSIIFSLCKQPYCAHTTFNSANHAYIAYILIFSIEYFNLCLFVDMLLIKAYPGTRNLCYRLLLSWLGCLHFTTCLLSVFIAWLFPILALITRTYAIFPYATSVLYLCVFGFVLTGLYHSLNPKWTYINIEMHSESTQSQPSSTMNEYPLLKWAQHRYTHSQSQSDLPNNSDALLLCQITDPHIGPLMTVQRLQRLCTEIVSKQPDIVLLTGDYFTGEANCDGLLIEAFAPLKDISEKCFACLGNHDMESGVVQQRTIRELKSLGITVLRDESKLFKSRLGFIQIIGYDYCDWRYEGRGNLMRKVLDRDECPKQCRQRRVVLLHDPGAFKEFVGEESVVVFSGHTHGGHVGFVHCGLNFTLLRWVTGLPDNGLWQKGNCRMYVHKGQGSRALMGNYVIRCGVPTEQSCIRITW